MDWITAFFGRFHPLLVHLPIGILFVAFLFECLSARDGYKKLGKSVQPALLWGTVFAIAAAISGFFLRQEGGYDEDLADLHQNLGIATAVLCLGVYVVRRRLKYWIRDRVKRKRARVLLFVPLIVLLSITGHWGGSLTHGEDYLFAVATWEPRTPVDPAAKIQAIANIDEAVMYHDVIQPILEARCYDCHSSSKQKGDLRLDDITFITRGGESGEVIRPGPADSSSLFSRLVLPLEHDDHMPPGEKPQLSSSEIALIKYWIEEDASFEKPVGEFAQAEKIRDIIVSLQKAPQQTWIPAEEVEAAGEEALTAVRRTGVTPMPLAEGSHYLMVSFTGFRAVTDEQINSLLKIGDQLVWLNLGHTPVTDAQLQTLGQLKNLRVLYLNNTAITDDGLAHLADLSALRWLNVVGTRISDASITVFEKLPNLSNLFVFGTDLTDEAIRRYAGSHDDVQLDTGNYRLEPLATDTIVYRRES